MFYPKNLIPRVYSFSFLDSLIPSTKTKPVKGLDAKVEYHSRDSMNFDIETKKVYLFGDAEVIYGNIQLKADLIIIDWNKNLVRAEGMKDSAGINKGKPVFSQDGQSFDSDLIEYNFKTKKGRIRGIYTKQGDGFILGEQVIKNSSDAFFIRNGKYTTCNNPENPHFYIRAGKIKVLPNDKIVTGPANLFIEDIPTPLAVPFGLFPNTSKRKSGIVFPAYGESPALGFFLKDGGYYFGINDYMDATFLGSIYSNGSWGLSAGSDYNLRYHFQGRFSLGYSKILQGDPQLKNSRTNRDFFIRWQHTQDAKSNPYSRFSANVQAGTSNYNFLNSQNPSAIITNTFQSAISYTKTFPNSPWSMILGMGHSQNTANRIISLSLPDIQLNRNRAFPFRGKSQSGAPRWYEKIGYTYTFQGRNSISIPDSVYGRPGWERKFQNGIQHIIPINTSFQMFRYITVTPGVNLSWRWYFNSIRKSFSPSQAIITDTISGFHSLFDYNANLNMGTRIFSFLSVGKNIIRHVMVPQIGFRYQPDFSTLKYINQGGPGTMVSYSPYEQAIFGFPSAGRQGLISFSLNNNLEAKIFSGGRDTAQGRKVVLFDAINLNTSYNTVADSLRWQPIAFSARTKIFKKIDLVYNGFYDLYTTDKISGRRINTFQVNNNGKLLRMINTGIALSMNLASAEPQKKSSNKVPKDQINEINRNPEDYVDFDVPWSVSANYNFSINKSGTGNNSYQVLNLNGRINVTSKWRLELNSGYDIREKNFSFSTVDIYRDLHCWQMHFSWIPFGFRRSFNFTINVKSSVLQDLKLVRRRQWFDLQGGQ